MDAGDVKAQLERILCSPGFTQAVRLSRFLRLVVEASQNGATESLKEYRIGVEVFDRGQHFDPRVDPIVRVEAARLRAKLAQYYASDGAQDAVLIGMPKGSYAPDIRLRGTTVNARAAAQPPLERSRIAVLPFVNMSADPDNEYFSDGLTEELINRLACVPSLHVVARTSAFRYKGRHEDVRQIGAQLNAGSVLEGSVRRSAGQVRVTAQLVDVCSGYHLFSRTYQRELGSVFALQDELAQAVADEIVLRARGEVGAEIAKALVANPDAYNHYLRGMWVLSTRAPDLLPAVDIFREALRVDPAYAPAWAGLAQCYWLLAWYRQLPSTEAMPLSKQAALKALELDPGSAQGHASLGIVLSGFEWRWAAAELHFKRAIELQPSLATIYPFYAVVCLLPQLKLDEACRMIERGLSHDPFNLLTRTIAMFIYGNAGRHEDVLRQHALAMEINPSAPSNVASLALAREWRGEVEQAIAGYRTAIAMAGEDPHFLSFLGHALALTGRKAEAKKLLRKLLDLDIARVYTGLRDADEALRWLEAAAECRAIHLLTVPADRRFDWLRSQARFQHILRLMWG
jgi:TolB-like protein/Tfp pilus assembly protein PilF